MKKHMNNAIITVIPHKAQAYDTAGDYRQLNENWTEFKISQMEDDRYEFSLACHEFIEQFLTKMRSISEDEITQWDLDHIDHPDPGSIEGCPYFREHAFSVEIEKLLMKEMSLDFDKYYDSFDNLKWRSK
jgi:hypothetical protein